MINACIHDKCLYSMIWIDVISQTIQYGFWKAWSLRDFQEHEENFHLLETGHLSRLNLSPQDSCAGYWDIYLVASEDPVSALCPGWQISMDQTPLPFVFQLGSPNGRYQQESLEVTQVPALHLYNPESESLLKFCALGTLLASLNSNNEEEIGKGSRRSLPRVGDSLKTAMSSNYKVSRIPPHFLYASFHPQLPGELSEAMVEKVEMKNQKNMIQQYQEKQFSSSNLPSHYICNAVIRKSHANINTTLHRRVNIVCFLWLLTQIQSVK